MKRRIITSMLAAVLLVSLVASPAAAVSPGSGSAAVTVEATVNARVFYTVVDHDHIDLRSNAPWKLTLESAADLTYACGPSTHGKTVRLEIPQGTNGYFVTVDR